MKAFSITGIVAIRVKCVFIISFAYFNYTAMKVKTSDMAVSVC